MAVRRPSVALGRIGHSARGVLLPALLLPALLMPALLMLGGCSRSGGSGSAAASSSPVPPTTTVGDIAALAPSTTVAGAFAADAGQAAAVLAASGGPGDTIVRSGFGLATPTAATRNLWDAWRDDDRPRAEMFATRTVVDVLFGSSWSPQHAIGGCASVEAGWACSFEGPTARWSLIVSGDERVGFRVTDIAVVAVRREPGRPLVEGRSTIVDPASADAEPRPAGEDPGAGPDTTVPA
jgi:hypothetical protein